MPTTIATNEIKPKRYFTMFLVHRGSGVAVLMVIEERAPGVDSPESMTLSRPDEPISGRGAKIRFGGGVYEIDGGGVSQRVDRRRVQESQISGFRRVKQTLGGAGLE